MYLLVNHASGYIEVKNGNKYLISDDSVNENKRLLKKYADVWDGIKNENKAINGGKLKHYIISNIIYFGQGIQLKSTFSRFSSV